MKKTILFIILFFALGCLADVTDTDAFDWEHNDCDSVTTGFTYSFQVNQSSDVLVILYNTSTDVAMTLTETSDYVVSVTNNDFSTATGGTVTTVSKYSSNYDLIITTEFTMTQLAQMTYRWRPSTVEDAIDKSRLIDRQFNRNILRSVRGPEEDDPDLNMKLPNAATRASGRLGFDTDGEVAIITGDLTGVAATDWGASLVDDANAAAGRTTLNINIINVLDYGAAGDGETDDTAAIVAAMAASVVSGHPVYFPAGTYLSDKITISDNYVVFYGDNPYKSIIKSTASSEESIEITGNRVRLINLGIDGDNTATKVYVNEGHYFISYDCRYHNHTTYQVHSNAIDVAFYEGGMGGEAGSTATVLVEYNKVLFDHVGIGGGAVVPSVILEIVDSDKINNITFRNCLMESTIGKTIWVKDNVDGLIIENNWFESSFSPVPNHVDIDPDVIVQGCKISENWFGGGNSAVTLNKISRHSQVTICNNVMHREAYINISDDPNDFINMPEINYFNNQGPRDYIYLEDSAYRISGIETKKYYTKYDQQPKTKLYGVRLQTEDDVEVSFLEIYIGASATYPQSATIGIEIYGRDAAGKGTDVNYYSKKVLVKNTGNVAITGWLYNNEIEDDTDFALTIDTDGADTVRVRITGKAATDVNWNGDITIERIG